MSTPDALERIRMCVAEAGYDPALIMAPRVYPWATFETAPGAIPAEVRWRAKEVSLLGDPVCLACSKHGSEHRVPTRHLCSAVRRMELDCGADR